MISLRSSFICDDVRYEVGGKITAVGIYNEAVIFPPEAPLALPKLAVVFTLAGLRGWTSVQFRFFLGIVRDPGVEGDASFASVDHTPQSDTHTFVAQIAPVVFPQPGATFAVLMIKDGDAYRHFEHRFEVVQAPGTPA